MPDWYAGLWTGLLAGLALAALVAAGVLWWAYRRFVVLERRAREAERLAELGTLTGGLAHEIKNPLSTIGLNLQLLAEDLAETPEVPPRTVKRLDRVRGETTRLRDILDDFLNYAGRLEIEPKPIDLVALLDEIADFFAPQAAAAGVKLRLDRHSDVPPVTADENRLKQAILNLCLNATQHMPDGGTLTLSVKPTGRRVEIAVADTGPGIAPDVRDRLFEAYFSRRKGGTGLGLAMTRRILLAHDGDVTATSTPGQGSTFTLTLPTS
jgi:signal transduction histidine kinase